MVPCCSYGRENEMMSECPTESWVDEIYQDRNTRTYFKSLINRLAHICVLYELIELEITQMTDTTKLFPKIHKAGYFSYPWGLPIIQQIKQVRLASLAVQLIFTDFADHCYWHHLWILRISLHVVVTMQNLRLRAAASRLTLFRPGGGGVFRDLPKGFCP